MEIKTKRHGLSAYMMMNGAKLKRIEGEKFVLESEKSGGEWRISYAQSESARFNAALIELSNLKKDLNDE